MLKKIILSLIGLALILTSLEAGTSKRKGTAGAEELRIPVGSRGVALGGGVVAEVNGVDALFWNPAGASFTNKSAEAMFSHVTWIADIKVNYLSAIANFGGVGVFGVSLKSLDFGEIPVTTVDEPDGTGERFSPTFLTAAVSYSRRMTDRIYVGANLKLISERILRESATGFAVDIGLQYRLESGLKFGAVMKNVGGNMKFDGPDLEWGVVIPGSEPGSPVRSLRVPLQEFELPAAFELGFAYSFKIGESALTLAGSFQNNNFTLDEYKGGLEYSFKNMLFLRVGYSYVNETDYVFNSPSFGVGFNIPLGGTLEASVEYTYRKVKFFDNNQFLTLRFAM
jgi:opacity protein-like surface antigen